MTNDRQGAHPPILRVGEEPPPLDLTPAPSSNGESNRQSARHSTPNGKPGERFILLNAFVDFSLAELSRSEIAVWLVLYRDTRDRIARTSYDDIARRAGLNRRNVGRAIRKLETRRLINVVYRGGLGRGASRYRVQGKLKDS